MKRDTFTGSFNKFVFVRHRQSLKIALAVLILQFIAFKYFYPHAFFTYDSVYYVKAAAENASVNKWPIAYSKILRIVSAVIRSDWGIVSIQYLMLNCCILYLYYTIIYFLQPGKWIAAITLYIIILNPLVVSINNYILSDSIFIALTLLWFTTMVWHIQRPKPIYIYLLATVIFILFTLRYYAIFYPIITLPIIIMSDTHLRHKLSGIALGLSLFFIFIWHTGNQYKKLLGYREFSPFSGWQLAGNAMIMYRNFDNLSADTVPEKLQRLHTYLMQQIDSFHHEKTMPDSPLSVFYMWIDESPLRKYMKLQTTTHEKIDVIQQWASVGRLYNDYGSYIITRHPGAYFKYFMLKNVQWYFDPTLEFLNVFPNNQYTVDPIITKFYDYSSDTLRCRSLKIYSLGYYQIIMNLFSALLALTSFGYYINGCARKNSPKNNKIILLAITYIVTNFIFIVSTASVMLRYGIPIMIINTLFGIILFESTYNQGAKSE